MKLKNAGKYEQVICDILEKDTPLYEQLTIKYISEEEPDLIDKIKKATGLSTEEINEIIVIGDDNCPVCGGELIFNHDKSTISHTEGDGYSYARIDYYSEEVYECTKCKNEFVLKNDKYIIL